MPVHLKRQGEMLAAKLSGYDSRSEFNDDLKRVKEAIPSGRRWNPDEKQWEFPATPENALKLMNKVSPVADAAVQSMVTQAQREVAESLISAIPDDGELQHPALRDILFPHQRSFVAWGQEHPHSLLCDEMGIGKTIQAICMVLEADFRSATGNAGPLNAHADPGPPVSANPVLVVVPNGLRKRWRREIIHGPCGRDGNPIYPDWPSSDVQILDGKNPGARRAQLAEPADFYITNWEKLRTDDFLQKRTWRGVIADEAHRAKNRKAQQTKGLLKLRAPIQLALTGTPVMNTPDELWPLLKWIRPEQYTSFWEFHYAYVDDYPTKFGRVMRGVKNTDDLRFELADKMVRRTKAEVLPDLPAKLPPEVIEVDLNDSERRLYAEAERALLLDVAKAVEREAAAFAEAAGSERPQDFIEEAAAEFADLPLDRLQGVIDNGAARIQALRQITAQAKAREAVEIIRDNPGKPFVTFTWYVPPARWIAEQLQADHQSVSLIAGSGGDPEEAARAFQAGETDQCVCSIAKGGTGIDLYRASTAIFADEDWVPDINRQALDRLHRQGQTAEVSSIILRVPDTVDTGKVAPANAFKEGIIQELFGAR